LKLKTLFDESGELEELTYKILWSTIEDFVGLWEIEWEVNSFLTDNMSFDKRDIARKILKYLISRDLIQLNFSK